MKKAPKFIILPLVIAALALAACSTATPTASSPSSDGTSNQTTNPTNGTKLNLNTVSGDELLANIPGFSNRMVREFHEYRPYVSIQQFRREVGKYVGDAQVAEYEKYVYVPVSINDSDSETLQQIPGLDAGETETLMTGRPYASVDDFLAQLSTFVAADELETAKMYLGEN